MVSSTNNKNYHGKQQRVKPTNMIIATSPANQTHRHHLRPTDDNTNNNDDDYKSHSQASTPNTSPSINPIRTIGSGHVHGHTPRHHRNRTHRRRINPSDFLKHSLDKAFWRLDQNTLDKMIASGNSPHVSSSDIKITQHDGLLTETEKKYIQKRDRHKHRDQRRNKYSQQKQVVRVHKGAVSSSFAPQQPLNTDKVEDDGNGNTSLQNPMLLATPKSVMGAHSAAEENKDLGTSVSESDTITPILGPSSMNINTNIKGLTPFISANRGKNRKNDISNSLQTGLRQDEEEENKYDIHTNKTKAKQEVDNMLAGSIKWKPQYPLHLLEKDKQYKRHNDHQLNKKRKQIQKLKSNRQIVNYNIMAPSGHHKGTETLSTFDSELSDDLNYKSMMTDYRDHDDKGKGKGKVKSKGLSLQMPFSRSLNADKLGLIINKKNKKGKKQIMAQSKSRNKRLGEPQHLSTMFDPETFEADFTGLLSPQLQGQKGGRGVIMEANNNKKSGKPKGKLIKVPKPKQKSKAKSKLNPISRFLSAQQPMSQSMTKKRNANYAPFLSPASSLYSDTEDHYDNDYHDNNAALQRIVNESSHKDISFLPPSDKSKKKRDRDRDRNRVSSVFALSDSRNIWSSDAATTTDAGTDDDDDGHMIRIPITDNLQQINQIELAEEDENFRDDDQVDELKRNISDGTDIDLDLGSSVVGSNLSKSLLLTGATKIDDELSNTSSSRKRGYTTESADIDGVYSRKIITPYELRKQHSLLRMIDSNSLSKNDHNGLLGVDEKHEEMGVNASMISARSRELSNSHNMHKLMGPLYSEEEKQNWNNMKKVDNKYENVLKKRRKRKIQEKQAMMHQIINPNAHLDQNQSLPSVSPASSNILAMNMGTGLESTVISRLSGTDTISDMMVTPGRRSVIGGRGTGQGVGGSSGSSKSTQTTGFWGSMYNWLVGEKDSKDDIEPSTQHISSSNKTNSTLSTSTITTTTTTATLSQRHSDLLLLPPQQNEAGAQNGNENILTSPLLLEQQEVDRQQQLQQLAEIEKRETETTQISFWRDIVIPNWELLHKTSVVRLFWEREGIPKSCRGQVWYYAIGNKLNVPLNSYDNIYKVSQQQIDDYLEFLENEERENQMSNKVEPIKSILGGATINTKSILGGLDTKTTSIIPLSGIGSIADSNNNPSGTTVNFCEGLKRKNSIERDISRLFGSESFEDLTLHSIDKKHQDIASVLMAFCNCRKSISYIQFMTHLTQILLHYQSPKVAFISLSNMVNTEIFEIYIHCNVSEIRQRIEIFTKMLVYNASDIARHLQKLSILADTYVMDWCNGLFSAQLPLNIVSRIWDLYFLNGEIIIWKCSVALLIILNENLNITKKSHHKIVKILQSIKKSLKNHNIELNEEYFVKKIYSIKLPRDVRKWFKRKELSLKKKKRKKKKRHKRKHKPQNRNNNGKLNKTQHNQ